MAEPERIDVIRDAVRRIDQLLDRVDSYRNNEVEQNRWLDPLEGFAGWLFTVKGADVDGEFPEEGATITKEQLMRFDEAIEGALDGKVHDPMDTIQELEAWAKELRTWLHATELAWDKEKM